MLLSTLSQLKEPLVARYPFPLLPLAAVDHPIHPIPASRKGSRCPVDCSPGCHPRQDLIPVAWFLLLGDVTLYLFPGRHGQGGSEKRDTGVKKSLFLFNFFFLFTRLFIKFAYFFTFFTNL